jgi:hypothetical protein
MTEKKNKEVHKETQSVVKEVHKESKKRTMFVSTDFGDVWVESNNDSDKLDDLFNATLILIDETKKEGKKIDYVT